jgi:hypothetical protein
VSGDSLCGNRFPRESAGDGGQGDPVALHGLTSRHVEGGVGVGGGEGSGGDQAGGAVKDVAAFGGAGYRLEVRSQGR